jgi:hypothetical protein
LKFGGPRKPKLGRCSRKFCAAVRVNYTGQLSPPEPSRRMLERVTAHEAPIRQGVALLRFRYAELRLRHVPPHIAAEHDDVAGPQSLKELREALAGSLPHRWRRAHARAVADCLTDVVCERNAISGEAKVLFARPLIVRQGARELDHEGDAWDSLQPCTLTRHPPQTGGWLRPAKTLVWLGNRRWMLACRSRTPSRPAAPRNSLLAQPVRPGRSPRTDLLGRPHRPPADAGKAVQELRPASFSRPDMVWRISGR